MSAAKRPATSVHRLVDMVVEEVSLVDRPANKQRFLIVKRDEAMAKSGAKGGSGAVSPKGKPPKGPAPGVEDPKKPEEEEDDPEEATPGKKPPAPPFPKGKKPAKKADAGGLLTAALSALEGLTEAVEMLATAGEAEAGPQFGELAEELDELADLLAQAAGTAPPDTAEEGEDPGGFGPADDGAVGKALTAVRETVKRVRGIITAAETAAKAEGGAATGEATTSVNKGAGAAAELTTELKTLRDTVQAQQQRIVALEKGLGLPNSAASDERTTTGGKDDDESWPMDMNRPRDRASVDKSISFHDDR